MESRTSLATDVVVLSMPESSPEAFCSEFFEEMESHDIPFQIKRQPTQIYASFGWTVPTLIVIYLAKPFLETLLKKAAEDAYSGLKKGFGKLLASTLGAKREERARRISLVISVCFQGFDGYEVKALIWEGIPQEAEADATEKLFKMIEEHYRSDGQGRLRELASAENALQWNTLYIRFNLSTRTWEGVDVVAESRNQRHGSHSE